MTPLLVLVVAFVAVALAIAAVEMALRSLLPPRIDTELSDAFGGPTTVELPPPPLLPMLLRGRLDEVVVHATAVPVGEGDGRIDALDVLLHDVTFSVAGGGRDLRAGRGTFEARIEEDSLRRLAELPAVVRSLEIEPDTIWVATVAGVRFPTSVVVRDGTVVVRPRARPLATLPFAELPVELPTLPAGAIVTAVDLRAGHLVATGPLDGDRLLETRAAPRG